MKKCFKTVSCILIIAIILSFVGCGKTKIKEASQMGENIVRTEQTGKQATYEFKKAQTDFAVELFKASMKENKNMLISPLSVSVALAMTANGAEGKTLEEMEKVLGGMNIEELNEYLCFYLNSLDDSLKSANSIWFRDSDRLEIKDDFLKTNVDYLDAQIYKAAFDQNTVSDINAWVDNNTDGMIDKIIEEIKDNVIMYLINALAFEAEWEEMYKKTAVYEDEFTAYGSTVRKVKMMSSEEKLYIEDKNATGFIKPYKGGKYSFAALLPKEGMSVEEYIASLDGEGLLGMLSNARNTTVFAKMPKFSYDCSLSLNDTLQAMGMPLAFDKDCADFSAMGSSKDGNISIGRVLHKTFIAVDEKGTKAGAVTAVEMVAESVMVKEDYKTVYLDRPFVYMIIDNENNLPVFMGAVNDISEEK